jgi:hypothetical protein
MADDQLRTKRPTDTDDDPSRRTALTSEVGDEGGTEGDVKTTVEFRPTTGSEATESARPAPDEHADRSRRPGD